MLAIEGVIMSTLSALYGVLLGTALSLILVYVINRQSFRWSIDLALPVRQLAALSVALIAAAALTALWSGRAAMSEDAIRAAPKPATDPRPSATTGTFPRLAVVK